MKFKELENDIKDEFALVFDDDIKDAKIIVTPELIYSDRDNNYLFTKLLFSDKKVCISYKRMLLPKIIDKERKLSEYKPLLIKIPEIKIKDSTIIPLKDKQRFKDNLETVFSFLNNSSIWVRVVDEDNPEKDVFKSFADLKLYKYGSAKENFDFNCRIQLDNWLEGDHGHDVTPILYGNESEFYKKLFE